MRQSTSRPEYNTPEYVQWRNSIFLRDKWQCVMCHSPKGTTIEAHHIKRWADFPNLRYVTGNGVTLCKLCHEIVTGKEAEYEGQFQKYIKGLRNLNPAFRKRNLRGKWRPRNFKLRF